MVKVKFMFKRFNLFRRQSASEKRVKAIQKIIDHLCEIYKIPLGTPLTEIKTRLERIPDSTKRKFAIIKFDPLLRELKKYRNQ